MRRGVVRSHMRAPNCPELPRIAAEGHLEMCKLLAAEGANLESSDRFERTPLFEACIGNRAEVGRALLF